LQQEVESALQHFVLSLHAAAALRLSATLMLSAFAFAASSAFLAALFPQEAAATIMATTAKDINTFFIMLVILMVNPFGFPLRK